MPYRVVQWSTGNVGRHSLAGIHAHPDLQLVGVYVSNPDKVGHDAGELAGLESTFGVAATSDVDALLALKPDCIVHTAMADDRIFEALQDLERFVAAGINVVSSSPVMLQYPAPRRSPGGAHHRGGGEGGRLHLRQRGGPGVRQRRTPARPVRRERAHRRGALLRGAQLRHLQPADGAVRHHGLRRFPGRGALPPHARRPHHGLGLGGAPDRGRTRGRP